MRTTFTRVMMIALIATLGLFGGGGNGFAIDPAPNTASAMVKSDPSTCSDNPSQCPDIILATGSWWFP